MSFELGFETKLLHAFGFAAAVHLVCLAGFDLRRWHPGFRAPGVQRLDHRHNFHCAYNIYFKFLLPALTVSEHWWWGISPERIRIPRGAGKAHEISV